jgi:TetR/AcrR family transcriptional regulator, transcriptional repressor for nem operon
MPGRKPIAAAARHATADQILDVAERLAQTRGFNGFSYADIATELGITKAALHYHFATKADLGRALIDRYATAFGRALAEIETSGLQPPAQLDRYVRVYADVLSQRRMCLCGMLAAEYTTLPDAMKRAIQRFFDDNEVWLARILEQGKRSGTLSLTGKAIDAARVLTASLEGAMLVARSYEDATPRFAAAATHLMRQLTPSPRRRRLVESRPPAPDRPPTRR